MITMPRRGGKTTHLVNWMVSGSGRVAVTFSEQEADRLRELIRRRDPSFDSRRVVAVHAAMQGALRGRHSYELGVDNADLVLAVLLGQAPAFMTVTGP